MRASLISVTMVFLLGACASTEDTRFGSDSTAEGNPDSAVYGLDNFTFRKTQKTRPATSTDFYYKHCDTTGDAAFYSKTSFWCTDPEGF